RRCRRAVRAVRNRHGHRPGSAYHRHRLVRGRPPPAGPAPAAACQLGERGLAVAGRRLHRLLLAHRRQAVLEPATAPTTCTCRLTTVLTAGLSQYAAWSQRLERTLPSFWAGRRSAKLAASSSRRIVLCSTANLLALCLVQVWRASDRRSARRRP